MSPPPLQVVDTLLDVGVSCAEATAVVPIATAVAVVARHDHGTTLSGFLPRGWDHLVASDGTTR
ncbi:MAG: hypothetical protein ACRDQX_16545, partial [Pseudonocardiaceae bacterium]